MMYVCPAFRLRAACTGNVVFSFTPSQKPLCESHTQKRGLLQRTPVAPVVVRVLFVLDVVVLDGHAALHRRLPGNGVPLRHPQHRHVRGRPGTGVQALSGFGVVQGQESGARGAREVAVTGPCFVEDTSRLSGGEQRCLCARLEQGVGTTT